MLFSIVIFTTVNCSKQDTKDCIISNRYQDSSILKNDPGEDDDIPIIITFKGKLVDSHGAPISNGSINLTEHELYSYSSSSDSAGLFEMDSVKKVGYQLNFSADGYQVNSYNVSFDTIEPDVLDWGSEELISE